MNKTVLSLLALADKATPGEWITGHMREPDGHALAWIGNHWVDPVTKVKGNEYKEAADDAAFIASAPLLAAELRKHAEMVDRLRAALEYVVRDCENCDFRCYQCGHDNGCPQDLYNEARAALTEQENVT